MHLQDVKISTHLKVGLSAIVLLVVLLGAVAWLETDILWQYTKGLFDHPLRVARAVGEIKAEILSMSRGMKDLIVSDGDQERQPILQAIDLSEARVHRQFEILYSQYLGPRQDIEEAFTLFVQWKIIRAKTIQLLREGRTAEAISSTKSSGIAGHHAEKLLGNIQEVSRFAEKRADKYYQDARGQNKFLRIQLAFMVSVICLLAAGVGSLLLCFYQ
ncbi:MAG: MCP four helix bundle domain-containing protein [Pseudomonadota bacterium]